MAKKHDRKKAIRAEVAQVLEARQAPALPSYPPSAEQPVVPAPTAAASQTASLDRFIRHDLIRMSWVAGSLLLLLAVATVTDRRAGWLDQAAGVVSHLIAQPARLAPLPLPAETLPAGDSPTSVPPAESGGAE